MLASSMSSFATNPINFQLLQVVLYIYIKFKCQSSSVCRIIVFGTNSDSDCTKRYFFHTLLGFLLECLVLLSKVTISLLYLDTQNLQLPQLDLLLLPQVAGYCSKASVLMLCNLIVREQNQVGRCVCVGQGQLLFQKKCANEDEISLLFQYSSRFQDMVYMFGAWLCG